MDWQKGGLRWVGLGFVLFLFTFGFYGLWILFYCICFIIGCLIIAFYHGKEQSKKELMKSSDLNRSKPGILKVMQCMENTTKVKNFDKRMTGASVIDEALQEVLLYITRDYIKSWYRQISDHDGFIVDVRCCTQKIAITFATRSKEVDWMPYFTQNFVEDFASHIRLYRRARSKIKLLPKDENYETELVKAFFELEHVMDKKSREFVCMAAEHEKQYLRDLSEILLYLLLPTEDFQNKCLRYILREVFVNGILLPTIELLSDPDYINQNLAWLCKENSLTNETFLSVVKTSDSVEELQAVCEITEQSISRWRSKDSGGADDSFVKQNLNSLVFVKGICENRIKKILNNEIDTDTESDITEICRNKNIFVLSLEEIIENNIALSVFIEYMTSVGGQLYLFFYLNVEGFRTAAEQQISAAHQQAMGGTGMEADLESLRRAAMIIYDQYLSDKGSSRIKIDSDIVKRTLARIKSKNISDDLFDEVQAKVYQILVGENYYQGFLQSKVYMKLLQDLGLMQDSKPPEDGDNISLEDDFCPKPASEPGNEDLMSENGVLETPISSQSVSLDSAFIGAYIAQTGVVKENKTGKSYAVFAVRITRVLKGEEDVQEVYRRYSDFHDLNMLVHEKYPSLNGPSLPGKTVLKNTNEEFLEKRRKALDTYLQTLLSKECCDKHPGLRELVIKFLAPGLWEKHKSELARKMDTIVNPLRTSVKKVVSNDVVDGLGRVFRSESSGSDKSTKNSQDGRVGIDVQPEGEENIPLRIMLLLMDEVIDLRSKNQWLRRRIVAILRQLIKATYGDMINRKIVDYVDWMTSAEQVAEYVKKFRDSFWPNGLLAEASPPRSLNTKMRTRVVCKAKMHGSVPDEMRHIMGTETIKLGINRVFDMFQNKTLNKRLVYVCMEGMLTTLFPRNKFPELFTKLHSRSTLSHSRSSSVDTLDSEAGDRTPRKRIGKR